MTARGTEGAIQSCCPGPLATETRDSDCWPLTGNILESGKPYLSDKYPGPSSRDIRVPCQGYPRDMNTS